jgi:hypothetical protein
MWNRAWRISASSVSAQPCGIAGERHKKRRGSLRLEIFLKTQRLRA